MSEDTKPAGSKSPAKRGRSRKAENGNGSAPEVLPEEIVASPEEQQQPDAVVILKSIGEDGTLGVDVQTMGGVQITEVQTLIELGLHSFRSRIGLGPKAS